MKRMMIYAVLVFLVLSAAAMAQVSQTAVPFLLIAPGARAGGMGESFVSMADDATATHWNPSGLGRYPLSPNWLEMPAGRNQVIQKIALVKNDAPDMNYKQYDIWAVINGRLANWSIDHWQYGLSRSLLDGASAKSAVIRYTGVDEANVGPYLDRVLQFNLRIKGEQLDSLQEILTKQIPSDYEKTDVIRAGFEELKTAYASYKISSTGFAKFAKMIESSQADSVFSTTELDSIAASFDMAKVKRMPDKINLPYDLILSAAINCLESHDGMIYAGTDSGFYRFDPKINKWRTYGLADSLPSLKITALEKMGRKSIVIGTDKGIVVFNGAKMKPYTPDQNAPTGHIKAIAVNSDQEIWAATGEEIYHYEGAVWKNYRMEEVNIGEDLDKISAKFYRAMAIIDKANLQKDLLGFNGIDSLPAVGQKIKLPFKPAFKSEITSLASKNKMLWVGTQNGIILYNGDAFYHFGYREYKADKPIAITDVARKFLNDNDPDKIERLSRIIKEYNRLEGDTIPEDASVMVYANALGSQISTVAAPSEKKAYVGTAYGVVEYNDGGWSRFSKLELVKTPVHTIKTEMGELWFASTDKVYVLARAKGQATFMHSNYLVQLADDLYYDYFAIVYPTNEWGTFGSAITFLSYGQQARTNEIGEEIGQFNSYDFAWTVSYGSKLSENISAGLSGKIIISHLADVGAGLEKGSGVGFSGAVDGGILYEVDPKITLGATITNFGPEIAYIDADQADPLPRKLAVAATYKLINSPYNKLSIVGEANKLLVDLNDDISTEIEEIIPHIGAEYWYASYFSLRLGYVYDKIGVQRYLTLGGSLQYTRLRIDLSYIPSSNESTNRLGNTIRISLNVDL